MADAVDSPAATAPIRSGRARTAIIPESAKDWIEIPVPAIVGEETVAMAKERLAANKAFLRRRTRTPSVAQGLACCSKCGYAMYRTSTRSSARVIYHYRCPGSDACVIPMGHVAINVRFARISWMGLSGRKSFACLRTLA